MVTGSTAVAATRAPVVGFSPIIGGTHVRGMANQLMAAVGIPTWILLLFLFPFTGLGPLLCLTGATLVTAGIVVWNERRRVRPARGTGSSRTTETARQCRGSPRTGTS